MLKYFKSEFITGIYELGELYDIVIIESKKTSGKNKDFHFAWQKKNAVEEKMNLFNNALRELFEKGEEDDDKPNYLGPKVNYYLSKLYPNLHIDFNRQLLQVDNIGNLSGGKIFLNVTDNGASLDTFHPQFVLNESKLSAIAISIFLGVIVKQSPFSREIKPLFLDDILIGLDNENRLKLLHLLIELKQY